MRKVVNGFRSLIAVIAIGVAGGLIVAAIDRMPSDLAELFGGALFAGMVAVAAIQGGRK